MPSAINSAHTQFFEKTAFHPGAWQNKTPTGDSKIQTAANRTIAISQHEKASPAEKRKIALLAGGLGLISGALVIGAFGGFGNASCGCSPCPPSSPSPCP